MERPCHVFVDLQVIEHSSQSPCVYVGSGTTIFNEYHGNFDIEDTIERRIPLSLLTAVSDRQYKFASVSDSSLSVMYLRFYSR